MRAFTVVWAGQVLSLLGTGMSRFALAVWAYQITGEATALALVTFFSVLPAILASPVAGVLVDRWNRKLVMMLSDLLAGVATIGVLYLYVSGGLQVWHLYVAAAFAGVGEAFQWPAYSAAISTMLRKEQYGRADGMMGLASAASEILSPFVAGALLAVIGLGGILVVDIVTFLIAIVTLALVVIPRPAETEFGKAASGGFVQQALYGFRYIWQRPSLFGLLMVFLAANFIFNLAFLPLVPMILARTGGNEQLLGIVQSVGAVGGAVGGLWMSLWGGPKRRVVGYLTPMIVSATLGSILLGLAQSPVVWAFALFCESLVSPVMMGSQQAIWQAKVAPDIQGRVFATRRLLGYFSAPIALLIGGPLADRVFAPAMAPDAPLAQTLGGILGTGDGAGLGLMMVVFGFFGIFVGIGGFLTPAVRNAETLLPDHDQPVDVSLQAAG